MQVCVARVVCCIAVITPVFPHVAVPPPPPTAACRCCCDQSPSNKVHPVDDTPSPGTVHRLLPSRTQSTSRENLPPVVHAPPPAVAAPEANAWALWPPAFATKYAVPCPAGWGICVSETLNLIALSCTSDMKVYLYSLTDGTLVRSIGGKGAKKGQLNFDYGGVSVSHRGTLLVAEWHNDRVQELNVETGAHVRYFGDGGGMMGGFGLLKPRLCAPQVTQRGSWAVCMLCVYVRCHLVYLLLCSTDSVCVAVLRCCGAMVWHPVVFVCPIVFCCRIFTSGRGGV